MSSNRTLWKIKVDVHQVYNLLLPDSTELPDPYIAASLEMPRSKRVGGTTTSPVQRTVTKTKMSSGTFNSVMLFIANIYDFDFGKVKLLIRVHNGKKISQLFDSDGQVLGTTTFSLSKVYSQAKHWIPREWLPITSPTSPGDCRGYVLVSIGVFGPGDNVPSQLSEFQMITDSGGKDQASRSLADKIVQTPETSFHNCMLVFNVLRAENLPVLSRGDLVVPSSGYVRVSFVGIQAFTRTIPSNANPAWNESIKIPVLAPSWDQFVVVEIFSRSAPVVDYMPPSSVMAGASTEDTLLGVALLDFDFLAKAGIQPTWFNFYSAPGARNPSFAHLYGSEYSGRIQVSASVARSSEAIASVVPFDNTGVRDPATEEFVIFIDVYEISFLDESIDQVPREIWIQIQVGPNTFESAKIIDSEMTCLLGEGMGRLLPVRIHLPVDRSMAYDVVVSICGSSDGESKTRLCYARVGLDRFLSSATGTSAPEWLKLSTVASRETSSVSLGALLGFTEPEDTVEDSIFAVASVLASITALRLDVAKFGNVLPPRPARIPYDLQSYVLRFVVHQACNLPIVDVQNLTTAFARVTLAGVAGRTSAIPFHLYPVWNELIVLEVDIPVNPSLRPDVLVEIVEKNGATLGFASVKSSSIRSEPAALPNWYKLHSSQSLGVRQDAYVLCAATLVSKSVHVSATAIPRHVPDRGTFTVELLIVGVRLLRNYSIENLNKIEICWGRQRGSASRRIVTIKTSDPISGEGGQFNFCQPALLDLDLPVESIFQEFLEVRLLEQVDVSAKEANWWSEGDQHELKLVERPIGFGYIHLNPCYAWITDAERDHYRDLFRMKTHEELRKLEELSAAAAAAENDEALQLLRRRRKKTVTKTTAPKDVLEMEYIENEIDAVFGTDLRTSNYLALPVQFFNSVETESLFPDRFKFAAGSSKAAAPKLTRRKSIGTMLKAAATSDAPLAVSSNSRFLSEFVWEPTISRERQDAVRPELEAELESDLDLELLPYITVPLVTGSVTGAFQVVGYLKVRCRVKEKSVDSTELIQLQRNFIHKYQSCTRLVCRLYVLRAEGIVPSQTEGGMIADTLSSSYYLWVRNVCGDLIAEYPNCSIKDDGAVSHDINPEFNKCFQLPVSFPENSVLHIELYERKVYAASALTAAITNSSDILLGSAMIDIENRWFHPQFQKMLNLDKPNVRSDIPLESWTVRSSDAAGIPKGKLKLWVELMDQVTSMGRGIEMLLSPQPENLQVRIVLWRTRGIPNAPDEDQSHQGVSVFMQNLDPQASDTHYGSQDGTGTFNWRFVLNPVVPTDDASVRIQLQHRPLVGFSNVPIGEVSLDLSQELAAVRKTRRGIDLPRAWVPLSHPAFIGKLRGMIEIQVRIVTVEESRSFPVGIGREAPNQDPFLDGDDPHLVQHRNVLGNTSFGRSLSRFVDALKSGLKWGTILFIIGWVISGIVGLVVLLVSMGIIKF